jgi:hypothetical protein
LIGRSKKKKKIEAPGGGRGTTKNHLKRISLPTHENSRGHRIPIFSLLITFRSDSFTQLQFGDVSSRETDFFADRWRSTSRKIQINKK